MTAVLNEDNALKEFAAVDLERTWAFAAQIRSEIDLEPRGLGKAVDAMAHNIEIRESDIGALGHDQRTGYECLVALGHRIAPWESWRPHAACRRRDLDYRAFDREAALIENLDGGLLRSGCRDTDRRAKQTGWQAGERGRQPFQESLEHASDLASFP
jgi:hypothetical protein